MNNKLTIIRAIGGALDWETAPAWRLAQAIHDLEVAIGCSFALQEEADKNAAEVMELEQRVDRRVPRAENDKEDN